ncbi:hypothetical protein CDD83_4826 [Cordyceps sp. RAO-2017]|nr:hypothetical protein CDD83_4826 [Cordyceps sp. RAO-2017]
MRRRYAALTGDPYFAAGGGAEPWFRFLLGLELVVQLPLAVSLARRLRRPASGSTELAGLAFGCVTAVAASACCYDLWCMPPARLSPARKPFLLGAVYLPFALVSIVMAVDMYWRLLRRVRASDAAVSEGENKKKKNKVW